MRNLPAKAVLPSVLTSGQEGSLLRDPDRSRSTSNKSKSSDISENNKFTNPGMKSKSLHEKRSSPRIASRSFSLHQKKKNNNLAAQRNLEVKVIPRRASYRQPKLSPVEGNVERGMKKTTR